MEINQIFNKIVGSCPYNFQLESINTLCEGKSLILIAPTGSGKTEIPVISFLLKKNETIPPQMIYSLPTRTLIENLSKRIRRYRRRYRRYVSPKGFSTAFHHGKRIESEFFGEDIIMPTIDQTVGAYVCVPLSAPIKRGNVFAGSVSSAFLVFDEIHTFDPKRGLQTSITIIEHSSKLKLPFVVMSATLPDSLIKKIKNIGGKETEVKEVKDENEIKSRKIRRVNLHTRPLKENKKISIKEILGIYESSKNKKLIVICNTVDKAQQLYQQLKNEKSLDACVILIHSRFLEKDRKEKEDLLQKLFSRESREHVILISTQVIEVGMDISSDTMISELAPIDSLIQRAGRCARWGGSGDFYVFDVEDYGPYKKEEYKQIVNNTKEELNKLDNEILSWNLERKLVNKILSNYYREVLDESFRAEIMGTLFRALFERDKSKVEECVRDAFTCYVSIHDNPNVLCNEENDIFRLQKINVNVWVFYSKVKKLLENGVKIWSVEESNILDDYTFRFIPKPISDISEILPFKHYIVSPEGVYYDKDVGLIFGNEGLTNFTLSEKENIEGKEKEFIKKYDSWVNHANKTLLVLKRNFIPRFNFIINKFSKAFDMKKEDLIENIRIAVALHDIGKLNKYWQEKIKWDGKTPLAHTDKVDVTRIGIPHATVSAKALSSLYNEQIELDIPLLLAIAHHHSPHSQEYKPYEFINNWESVIEKLPLSINLKCINNKSKISDRLEFSIPYLGYENNIIPYRFYAFVSKILRLCDWSASCGEDVII